MAKVVYLDTTNGDDGNDGLSPANAVKTFGQASNVVAAGDRVSIAPGVYTGEHDISFTESGVVWMPNGSGRVTVDFENVDPGDGYWKVASNNAFVNLFFKNPAAGRACLQAGSTSARAIHCVFYQRDGAANSGDGVWNIRTQNCSFYNLFRGDRNAEAGTWSNYYNNVTTPLNSPSPLHGWNAYPGNTEATGIDTNVTDPGFTDAANEDFTLDSVTDPAAFAAFMTGGRWGERIGAMGVAGIYYDFRHAPLRMINPDPTPTTGTFAAWQDDPGFTGAGTGTIVQDPTTGELTISGTDIDSGAVSGRVISPVYDFGAGLVGSLRTITLGQFKDRPSGATLDTNTTLPEQFEYRASDTVFGATDGSPAWVAAEPGEIINVEERFQQYRVTFRRDHTNA